MFDRTDGLRVALVDVGEHHDVRKAELLGGEIELQRSLGSGGVEHGDDAVEPEAITGAAQGERSNHARGRGCTRGLDQDAGGRW